MSTSDIRGPAKETVPLPAGVPPLTSFYLYLSTGCNLACRHCWITPRFVNGVPSPQDVLDMDALMEAVAQARPLGLAHAKLTGGEPMLHPRFRDVVSALTEAGLSLDMESNGTLLDPATARWLKDETAVGFISVSLDGPDAGSHDRFRGVRGAHEAVLKGLAYLAGAGYGNVQAIMSVHRGNCGDVEAVARLAASCGAATLKLNVIEAIGRGAQMRVRGEALSVSEHLDLARRVREEIGPRVPIPILIPVPPALTPLGKLAESGGRCGDCGVLRILGILGTGEIALCGIGRSEPELVWGRLGVDDVRDLWLFHPGIAGLRDALSNPRKFPGICGDCVHASTCRTGCVASNWAETHALVATSRLCEEANLLGAFPATRRRGPTTIFPRPS